MMKSQRTLMRYLRHAEMIAFRLVLRESDSAKNQRAYDMVKGAIIALQSIRGVDTMDIMTQVGGVLEVDSWHDRDLYAMLGLTDRRAKHRNEVRK